MFLWWDILVATILGIVEGITEFIPVSSTGHMILVGELALDFTGARAASFEIVIQLGSILAVAVVFFQKILELTGFKKSKKGQHLTLVHIFFAMIPAGVMGVLFSSMIKNNLFGVKTVIIGLFLGAILMIIAEKSNVRVSSTNLDQISYKQAFTVGLFQCLALWPGFSRSGSTIAGGLISGIQRKISSEFSFIVALPMMVAATGWDLLKSAKYLTVYDLPLFVVGFLTAFLVALFAIRFFLKLIEKVNLLPFAIYRIILASVLAFLMYFGIV